MNNEGVNIEGKRKVKAELLKRGADSVSHHKHGTKIDYLHATNAVGSRTVRIRVKVKRSGTWQTTESEGERTDPQCREIPDGPE